MKRLSLASATSIVLLLSGALLAGCASTPSTKSLGRCDTSQAVGSCAVTVQKQGPRLVVCPVESAASSPVCMNAAVDVQRGGQKSRQNILLEPGRCAPLSTEILSATAGSCEAFAVRRKDTELARSAQ